MAIFFFSSRRRHTRSKRDWSSDVCSSDLNGVVPSADSATITGSNLVGVDGSIAPLTSATENITRATAALTWQRRNGFFVGGGVSWNEIGRASCRERVESEGGGRVY